MGALLLAALVLVPLAVLLGARGVRGTWRLFVSWFDAVLRVIAGDQPPRS